MWAPPLPARSPPPPSCPGHPHKHATPSESLSRGLLLRGLLNGEGGYLWATVLPAGCLHTHSPHPVLHQADTGRSRLVDHLTTEMAMWANSLVPAECSCPQMAVKASLEVRVNPHEPSTTPVPWRPPSPPPAHTDAVLPISQSPWQALVPFHLPRVS